MGLSLRRAVSLNLQKTQSKTIPLLGNENQSLGVDCKVGYKLTMNYYTSFLHEVILHQIDVGDGLQTLKFLGSTHRHKLFKCLLHVEALGAGEELEFLRLEDKIESSDLAQVTLQVEGTIL